MPLESFTTDTINVRDLALDKPEIRRDLPFNPERDISADDWYGMQTRWEARRGLSCDSIRLAASMTVLGRRPALNAQTIQEVDAYLRIHLQEDPNKFRVFRDSAGHASIFMKPTIEEADWLLMEQHLERYRSNSEWGYFLILCYTMTMLGRPPKLTEDVTREVDEHIENDRVRSYTTCFVESAARTKFLGRKQPLASDDWQRLHHLLSDHRRKQDWHRFGHFASDMTILAAEDVRLTEKGPKVVLATEPTGIQPLPKVRQYIQNNSI